MKINLGPDKNIEIEGWLMYMIIVVILIVILETC
jgi:hypothetical protein